jgi:polyhydroxyalkanoate synthesis regulator phasin
VTPPQTVGYLEYDAGELGKDEGERVRDMVGERDLLIAELLAMVVEGRTREGLADRRIEELELEAELLRKEMDEADARVEELSSAVAREMVT